MDICSTLTYQPNDDDVLRTDFETDRGPVYSSPPSTIINDPDRLTISRTSGQGPSKKSDRRWSLISFFRLTRSLDKNRKSFTAITKKKGPVTTTVFATVESTPTQITPLVRKVVSNRSLTKLITILFFDCHLLPSSRGATPLENVEECNSSITNEYIPRYYQIDCISK